MSLILGYWHIFLESITIFLEVLGVFVIFFGIIFGIIRAIISFIKQRNSKNIYTKIRQEIAHAILLGLEILIAVDIIKSMDANLDLQSIFSLGLIIIIRTILSISLEWEIEDRLPWKNSEKNTEK